MIISSNKKYTIQVDFSPGGADISFIGLCHPDPHGFNYYNHIQDIVGKSWILERSSISKWDSRDLSLERKIDITKGEIDFLYPSYGENINKLTQADLKDISQEIANCVNWLFHIGYKKVTFSPMDWGRYIATKRILRPFIKRADIEMEEKACHHIVDGMYYDKGDFDGKITIELIKGEIK